MPVDSIIAGWCRYFFYTGNSTGGIAACVAILSSVGAMGGRKLVLWICTCRHIARVQECDASKASYLFFAGLKKNDFTVFRNQTVRHLFYFYHPGKNYGKEEISRSRSNAAGRTN